MFHIMKEVLPFWNTQKQQIKSKISALMCAKNKLRRNVLCRRHSKMREKLFLKGLSHFF